MNYPAAAPDPWIGHTVAGRYHVERKLGSGGMGTVYRATQAGLGRPVAVKLLKPEVAFDQATVTRFQREAKAMSRLEHPNTVKVFDFGRTEDGTLFFAMELLQGEVVTGLLERQRVVSPLRVIEIGTQALSSLHEAHTTGLVHRDLPPDNIYLARVEGHPDPVVKVLDFGIAKIFDGENQFDQLETQAGTVFGTPRYMSPEQAQGKSLDPRTDIYTVGVLLYQLLTGSPPFVDDDAIVVMAKHIKEKPKPILEVTEGRPIPERLASAVMRALAKKPEERWQTAEEFAQALAACREEATLVERTGALPAAAGSARRGLTLAAAVLLLGVVGGIAFALTRPREVEAPPAVASAPDPAEALPADAIIDTDPPGAEVWSGDELLGHTPLRYPLGGGEDLEVELRAEGYESTNALLVAGADSGTVELSPSTGVSDDSLPARQLPGQARARGGSERGGDRSRAVASAMSRSSETSATEAPVTPAPTPMMAAPARMGPYVRFD